MGKIDRKEFLHQSVRLGGCCGAALLAGTLSALGQEPSKPQSVFTPCPDRVKQGQEVIKRLVGQMDQKLDKATRDEIMESCGRRCHDTAYPAPPSPTPEAAARFLEGISKSVGKENIEQSGDETVVHYQYTQNPRGLKVADGYCLCPIMEDAPKGVSPTYCQCSVGYVRAIVEQGLGKPAKVELTESILRGGKGCHFIVRFRTA
jgi:predicted hydrocarbon binding protein